MQMQTGTVRPGTGLIHSFTMDSLMPYEGRHTLRVTHLLIYLVIRLARTGTRYYKLAAHDRAIVIRC
jgi:hypothetical protein